MSNTTVVALDGLGVDYENNKYAYGFRAEVVAYWNGWACPIVSKATAEAFVRLYNEANPPTEENSEQDVILWDGDVLVVRSGPAFFASGEGNEERIDPQTDGRYGLLGWNYCWSETTEAECIEVF